MTLYSSYHILIEQLFQIQQIHSTSTSLLEIDLFKEPNPFFFILAYLNCPPYGGLRCNALSQRNMIWVCCPSSPINPYKVLLPLGQHVSPSSGQESQCLFTLVRYHQLKGKTQSCFFFFFQSFYFYKYLTKIHKINFIFFM